MQLQFLSQSVLIRPTSDRHLQNKITWIKTKKKKKFETIIYSRFRVYRAIFAFRGKTSQKLENRFTVIRSIGFSLIALSTETQEEDNIFFPPPSLPFPRRLCAIHREGRGERKISPRDRSIANRCLSIQIQYLPHTRTRSPFLSQPPYLVVSRRQRGYFGDKGGQVKPFTLAFSNTVARALPI